MSFLNEQEADKIEHLIAELMKFYKGGLGYIEAHEISIAALFNLHHSAIKIDRAEAKAMKSGAR